MNIHSSFGQWPVIKSNAGGSAIVICKRLRETLFSLLALLLISCNSKAQIEKEKLNALIKLALESDSLDNYKKSIYYYNQILEMDSVNFLALVNRGRAFIATSKTESGFADLNKVIKHWPNDRAYLARGASYLYIKNIDSAERDLKMALMINPRLAEAYYGLVAIDIQRGNFLAALVNYKIPEQLGLNTNFSLQNSAKNELEKVLGINVLKNYSSDNINKTIDSLPVIKKAKIAAEARKEYASIYKSKLKKDIYWFYIIDVEIGESIVEKFTFIMDASTLKVTNQDGK